MCVQLTVKLNERIRKNNASTEINVSTWRDPFEEKLKQENRFIDRKLPTKYCMSTCPLMSSGSHIHYVLLVLVPNMSLPKTYRDLSKYSGLTSRQDQSSRFTSSRESSSAAIYSSPQAQHETFVFSNALFYLLRVRLMENIFADEGKKNGSVDARCS